MPSTRIDLVGGVIVILIVLCLMAVPGWLRYRTDSEFRRRQEDESAARADAYDRIDRLQDAGIFDFAEWLRWKERAEEAATATEAQAVAGAAEAQAKTRWAGGSL